MFGRQSKEKNQPEEFQGQGGIFSPETTLDLELETETAQPPLSNQIVSPVNELKETTQEPEMVNVVEKVSKILSPYFIVVVGLFLYKDNFLIGTTLIAVGVLYLLNISLKDLGEWAQKIGDFLGLNKQS